MYEDLVELIARKKVAFPPFGTGVSTAAIDSAQKDSGIQFPPSYCWWLRNYGGGQIAGDLVYGLDERGIGMPDVVRLHKVSLSEGRSPQHLVFYIGNEESFYFDTGHPLESGEYRIYYQEHGQPDEEFAQSFDAFLRRRIVDILGN